MRKHQSWLPKQWAKRHKYYGSETHDSCSRKGLTIHNEGVDGACTPGHVYNLAAYVVMMRIPYHAIWCPRCGVWVQIISFNRAARSMVGGAVAPCGNSANKHGQNIQVCIADYGYRDFTKTQLKNAWVLAEILDAHNIPWRARKTWSADASRRNDLWNRGGIQGHQHGPNDDHTDPNSIDAHKLLSEAKRQQKARNKRLAK